MVDRVCGKGDIDTVAIRRYFEASGSQILGSRSGEVHATRHVQQTWTKLYKGIGER